MLFSSLSACVKFDKQSFLLISPFRTFTEKEYNKKPEKSLCSPIRTLIIKLLENGEIFGLFRLLYLKNCLFIISIVKMCILHARAHTAFRQRLNDWNTCVYTFDVYIYYLEQFWIREKHSKSKAHGYSF